MKYLILLLLLPAFTCFAQPRKTAKINSLTKNEIKQGWLLLFDGKTLDSWRGLGRDHVPLGYWKVENGMIHKVKRPSGSEADFEGGDLATIDSFENFELYFEWKIDSGGNSGIKYNVSEELCRKYNSPHSALGFEYQMLDDNHRNYKGKLHDSQYTGSLYDLIPSVNVELRPIGEFNNSRILVSGSHIVHWLNGKKVMECDLESEVAIKAYKASKFKNIQGFMDKKAGHIVITNHGDEAWLRNMKIRIIRTGQQD